MSSQLKASSAIGWVCALSVAGLVTLCGGCSTDSAVTPDGGIVVDGNAGVDAPVRDASAIDALVQLDGGCAGAGLFLYVDTSCAPGLDASVDIDRCGEVGDGRCYQVCSSDSDCQDPKRSRCAVIGLFAGTDFSCTQKVRVCRSSAVADMCPV